ncbi:hypothetical protein C7C46_27360 [Streptomyces tateyamensis]|uniref:Right handed beta helix domain-containing protein n=1 Tax=Streptomyces tateyamensis TaxID=565073 RepID=A0A2V4NJ35_9ACTN|nr:hypothetical protein C7C46_27360 [Streptomyces tateyamensis]
MTALFPGSATAAGATTLYASPTGSGSTCSQAAPCSLTGAQAAVRALNPAGSGASVTVDLLDGTYRPSTSWKFTAADSGSPGRPVVWQAAPGAHPVISGASQVTGWTEVAGSGVWSAPVPAGSASRQLYVNGQEAPIAQASPGALGFAGGWSGSATGYSISGDAAATAWFAGLTPAQVAGVEFDYPAGNGAWTESRCRVASYGGGVLTMAQPCWTDVTARAGFSQGSGGLPSMNPSTMPALLQDAKALLHPGQWFLDQAGSTLYYQPLPGQQLSGTDVELPHLETLLQGAGTLAAPLHDLTFSGLQFSYATWNDPSSPAGFSDVQSNLRITGAHNQGMCTFANPAGSCPWGALTQPLANVDFTATTNLSLTGNRFAELGGAGLGVRYGARNTLVQGNEFTDTASTGLLLGCTADPNPTNPNPATDPDTAAVIKQSCTPDASAVSGDIIGTNEILTGTTVADNTVHHTGTDYSSAPGITLLFAQGTTITHNTLYDLPYDAITAGVSQGHTDQASTPENVVNINQNNSIGNNVFHDYMSVRSDGGAVYAEGHQAQYYDASGNPTTYDRADPVQTLAHGLQVTGNVAYNGHNANFTYYDDAGSEWINWQGNAGIGIPSIASTGGCSQTGHIWTTGSYFSLATVNKAACAAAVDLHAGGNTTIPATPGPGDLPSALLSGAGPRAPYARSDGGRTRYVSPVSGGNQVLIAGDGFGTATQVYAGGTPLAAGSVQLLGSGFLVATVPAGTTAGQLWVAGRVDDSDPSIGYQGFATSGNRGVGDLGDDVHYATADGSTASYAFTGATLQVYGELNTDQGTLGITVDGGTQQSVNTVPTDGRRHSNVPVFTVTGLSAGPHTVTVSKLSGQYATLDGFGTAATAPPALRTNDTDPSISYSGFAGTGNRGLGDYGDDVHYASADGSTASYTFSGSFVLVYGELNTDQGNIGVAIDGGPQQTVSTLSADGVRHSDTPVFSAAGLAGGSHTIVITKLSGQYSTLDGFGTP